jgi:putative acetyltransferase
VPAEDRLIIRPEKPADVEAIFSLTAAAFHGHPHSQQTEQWIVNALREAGVLSLSLVAEQKGAVLGHLAFSPVGIADGSPDWYGLGPVSVLPTCQGRGVGTALIAEGLARLQADGAHGCVVLGEPAYYGRFGFTHQPALVLDGVPPDYFLALPLGAHLAQGVVHYHAAFAARRP